MKLDRRSKLALKLVVSVGLFGWLVAEIGTHRIARSLSGTDVSLLAVAFLLVCGDNLLRAFNWRLLLRTGDAPPAFRDVLFAFLVGGFFGAFIPSSLGPDAARTVTLAGRTDRGVTRTASSVVMLNLLGLWGLAVVFVAGVVVLLLEGAVPDGLWALAAGAAGGVALLPALLASRVDMPELRPSSTVGEHLADFARALAAYRSAGSRLVPAFAIALANQLLAVLVVYTVFRAGGIAADPVYFMALVPALHVSRLVPASVAGFGAEQGFVVGLFGLAGVAAAPALAMSVLVSGLNLLVQAASGGLYVAANVRSLGREMAAVSESPDEGGVTEAPGPGGGDATSEQEAVERNRRGAS